MASNWRALIASSIFRKQLVAVSGLIMVGFIIVHLSGNLMLFRGPEAFNAYSKKLHDLGWLLWLARFGLIGATALHIGLTLSLWRENSQARSRSYAVSKPKGRRSFAALTMQYTGILIVLFLILHLYDFTFVNKQGPSSIVPGLNNDESLGLFGIVWNGFNDVWRAVIYILAVSAVGMHFSHAVQSVFQTFGLNHIKYTPAIKRLSIALGVAIALGYSTIPLYVLFTQDPLGV